MTDRPADPGTHDTDTELQKLETADPADAPQIAEDLANQLAKELDGTAGSRPSGQEDTP